MGGLLRGGGAKGMLAPLQNYLGGGCPHLPSSYAYGLVLRMGNENKRLNELELLT